MKKKINQQFLECSLPAEMKPGYIYPEHMSVQLWITNTSLTVGLLL